MSKKILIIGGASVLSFAAGSAAGYFLAVKNLKQTYEEDHAAEIAALEKYYGFRNKQYDTPADAVEDLVPPDERESGRAVVNQAGELEMPSDVVKRLRSYRGESDSEEDVTPQEAEEPEISKNIFENVNPDADFDPERDKSERTPGKPYIVDLDEFTQGVEGYSSVTLTYFEGDGTLADEDEQPIDNVDTMVGEENLVRFGHLSNDANVVYVRNDKMSLDMEILRSQGRYAVEVLGLDEGEAIEIHNRTQRSRERDEAGRFKPRT